jgi:hypothetical protein
LLCIIFISQERRVGINEPLTLREKHPIQGLDLKWVSRKFWGYKNCVSIADTTEAMRWIENLYA